jgi:1-acyl-sn-glycerol-3-phosphate acyltransferase
MNGFLRFVFRVVCRINPDDFKKIPVDGPMILVGNHINFLEVPVVIPHIDHPNVIGVSKRESWKNPLFNFLFNQWNIIPIDRGLVDREAFRLMEEALKQNRVIAISPEGTRSKTGKLLQGKPGVVAIAVRSDAPLLPVAFYGYENFWQNLKRFRKTDFRVVVGNPFKLNMQGQALSRDVRQEVTDEIMYKIAEILPAYYRGYYEFESKVNYKYLTPV